MLTSFLCPDCLSLFVFACLSLPDRSQLLQMPILICSTHDFLCSCLSSAEENEHWYLCGCIHNPISVLFGIAEGLSEGEWVQGGQWDDTLWGGSLPDASWIDSVTPNNPVFLTRMDVHMALVNTAALRAVGITAETPDPPGGKIHRDANGEPTGILGYVVCSPKE